MAHLAAESVPAFSGEPKLPDGSTCMPVREFLQRVDDIQASTGANQNQIAAAVKQKLCGAAYTALQVENARQTPGLDRWADRPAQGNDAAVLGLRTLLKNEFQKDRTPAQIHAALETLKQRNGEGAQAFFRRVELVTLQMNEDIPDDERTAGADLYQRMYNRDVTQRFLMGLPKDTRQYLIESGETTPAGLKAAAIRKETARQNQTTPEKGQGQVMEIQQKSLDGAGAMAQNSPQYKELLGEIAALKREISKGKTATQPTTAETPNPSSLPPNFCKYCSHEGHAKEQCRKKKADEDAGIFRAVHANFRNGGKPRRQKKQTDNTGSGNIAAVTTSQPPQPTQPSLEQWGATTYWQQPPSNWQQPSGNIAAMGAADFSNYMPPLN